LSFIEEIKVELGAKGFGRNVISNVEGHELREPQVSYHDHFALKEVHLRGQRAGRCCISQRGEEWLHRLAE